MKSWIAAAAAAAAQAGAGAPVPAAPTPLEHALVEYVCRTTQQALPGTIAYGICYDEQLTSLRAGFGRDLERLTAVERKAMDGTCGAVQETAGRDAYVACVNGQLTVVRTRRGRGSAATPAPSQPAGPIAGPEMPAPGASTAAAPAAPPPAPLGFMWWAAGLVGVGAALAAGIYVVLRGKKPVVVKCRSCGGDVQGAGDLCPACRREAAEARRRAAAGRDEPAGDSPAPTTLDPARRLAQEQEELERREQMRYEEEVRRQAEDSARRREELERRQQEDEVRRQREAAAADTFDPYAVLGLPADATRDAIGAAYHEARAKYAPGEYEHLGAELQDHFKSKADAVERAYLMLTSGA